MKQRKIADSFVGEIGLGCMGMSWAYGAPDDAESQLVLQRALELGVNHWDTADLYGAGQNERLLAKALKTTRDQVFLATKFGNVYNRSLTLHQDLVAAKAGWIVDGTPEYVRKSIDLSLQRLEVDHVDLYYQHRVDSRVPIEETVGAMAEAVRAGKVKYLGLSEASVETIRRAHATHPIAAVQSEFSLWTRDYQDDVVPLCGELGIAFVPYSPLGRGFLTGAIKSSSDLPEDDWRRLNPRFEGKNLETNLQIVEVVTQVANEIGIKPSQVALAWVLAQGGYLNPIPGTKRLKYLEENAGASDVQLSEEQLSRLSAVAPAVGLRYPEGSMSFVNR
jgi:aryl-alcohol dehydrogenase-like predicted oxidoreductase